MIWAKKMQIQRIQGQLHIGPVKTHAGSRDLPLIGLANNALAVRRQAQDADRTLVVNAQFQRSPRP